MTEDQRAPLEKAEIQITFCHSQPSSPEPYKNCQMRLLSCLPIQVEAPLRFPASATLTTKAKAGAYLFVVTPGLSAGVCDSQAAVLAPGQFSNC